MGYHWAGFDVTVLDIEEHPSCPFKFVQADVLNLHQDIFERCWHIHIPGTIGSPCLGHFEAVHISPPCQLFSTMTGPNRDKWPDLITPMRERLQKSGLPYVIENVPQAPLDNPVQVCGSAFGLKVRRHRAFESNVPIVGTGCYHHEQGRPVGVYGQHPDRKPHLRPDGTQRGTKATSLGHGQRAMGVDWMEWPDLVEAIPPAYSLHIGRQVLAAIKERAA